MWMLSLSQHLLAVQKNRYHFTKFECDLLDNKSMITMREINKVFVLSTLHHIRHLNRNLVQEPDI